MKQHTPVGRLLVEAGVLDDAAVAAILDVQARTGGRFCSIALAEGRSDERTLVRTLSRQLGVPGMALGDVAPEGPAIALIPPEAARRLGALPVRGFNRTLTLLMRDPLDREALGELQFLSGKVLRPLVALAGPLEAEIRALQAGEAPQATTLPPVVPADASIELVVPQTTGAAGVETSPAPVAVRPTAEPLPLVDHDGEPARRSDGAGTDPRPCILVVDDERDLLDIYATAFDPGRYRVETCARGDEALAQVRRLRPHLVLLDARLPGRHGFEICRDIKGDPELSETVVILHSAAYRGWQMRADLIQQCGADEFLEKPVPLDHLIERIDALLEGSSRPRATRPIVPAALRHLNQGLLLLQKGDLDAAADAFRRSIDADPRAARPHFYLGKIHERRDARFDAMYEYERAVALDAGFFPAIKDLAILYQSNGFVHKAAEMWQQALAACPEASMRASIRDHLVRLL